MNIHCIDKLKRKKEISINEMNEDNHQLIYPAMMYSSRVLFE